MKTKKSLSAIYSFPGFRARAKFKKGILGDSRARVVALVRRQKKQFVQVAAKLPRATMINAFTVLEILIVAICGFTWNLNTAELIAKDVRL
jgi:hypothetical protein